MAHIERLQRLADLLGNLKPTQELAFNLGTWVSPEALEDPTLYDSMMEEIELEGDCPSILDVLERSSPGLPEGFCGTTACAVGHACLDPWFNGQGLHLVADSEPFYQGFGGWLAVSTFFGLTGSEANRLFMACNYETGTQTTAAQVRDRILELIAQETNHG